MKWNTILCVTIICIALLLHAEESLSSQDQILEFTIVVPSFNNEAHVERNLNSLVKQKTKHKFEIIYVNDKSTDQTGTRVDEYIQKHNYYNLIRVTHNEKRVGASENTYITIHSCPDHKHIIIVDGDDELKHDFVIERVAQEYLYHNAWMTYGEFEYHPQGNRGCTPALPTQETIDKDPYYFRKNGGQSHLRTFKAKLYKKIKKEDLMQDGQFFQMAGDTAMTTPLLEMASKGHIRFIPDVLYLYYWLNPICDHNISRSLQHKIDGYIRSKPPYAPLTSLDDHATYIAE